MPHFLISYDLRKARNYDGLIAELRSAQFISPLKSVWLGTSTLNAQGVRDALRRHMDGDDGILVVEIKTGSNWATALCNENAADWLRQKISP